MNNPGQVYVVKADNGLCKIGMVNGPDQRNLQRRLTTLALGSPCALALIYSMRLDNARSFERYLHRTFDNKRTHGEWFHLDDSDLQQVKKLYATRKQEEQAERARNVHRPRLRDAFEGIL